MKICKVYTSEKKFCHGIRMVVNGNVCIAVAGDQVKLYIKEF